MERWFYRTEGEWTQWVERLKLMPCPHCQVTGTLNRHGILMGYDESQRQTLRARRVYCSNRHSQSGCGRTFSIWLADKIRRLSLSTHVVWRFLQQVITGSLAAATRSMTERSDRTWQRVWKRFQLAQSTLRTALLKRCPPPQMSSDRPEAQVINHLQAAFPVPVLILVALFAKFRLHGIRPPRGRIPELLRKLEKGCTTLLVR